MSRLAKDDVTRDSDQFRRRQGGPRPVTRRTIRNGTVFATRFSVHVRVHAVMSYCHPRHGNVTYCAR